MPGMLLIIIASALIGAAIGAMIMRNLTPQAKAIRELEQQKEIAEQKLQDYQQQVTESFIETSAKVNKLTESYKEVHEHLASSALELTNPEISSQFLESNTQHSALESDELDAKEETGESSTEDETSDTEDKQDRA